MSTEPTLRELDALLRRIELEFSRRLDEIAGQLNRVVSIELYEAHRTALAAQVAELTRRSERLDDRADALESTRATRADTDAVKVELRAELQQMRADLAESSKRSLAIWGLVITAVAIVIGTGTQVIMAVAAR